MLSVRNRRSLLSSLNLSISFLRSEYFSVFFYFFIKKKLVSMTFVMLFSIIFIRTA